MCNEIATRLDDVGRLEHYFFFYTTIVCRRRRNKVFCIRNQNGVLVSDSKDIAQAFLSL